MWFFVSPVKTDMAEEQEQYMDLTCKRWDSLAFQLMFEQVQDLTKYFTKVIPGGKGGAPSTASAAALPAGSSARSVAKRDRDAAELRAEESIRMQREVHCMKVEQYRATAALSADDCDMSALQDIEKLLEMKSNFGKRGPDGADMVVMCNMKIMALKAKLNSRNPDFSSTTPLQTSNRSLTPITSKPTPVLLENYFIE
jgi:hypothetical protein